MTTPGENVTARRESLKLSRREAARRASISPTAWGELEGDVRTPSTATQRGVSVALGWPVGWYDRLVAGDDLSVSQPDELERLERLEDVVRQLIVVTTATDLETEKILAALVDRMQDDRQVAPPAEQS